MLDLSIPGWGNVCLEYAVFDVNGTLATDGVLINGVATRMAELGRLLTIHLLTADTHGGQAAIDAHLGLKAVRVEPGDEREQKAAFISRLGRERVVAVGNGGNDAAMLAAAAIGIAVLGHEGLCAEALQSADILTMSILDALDILLNPKRLIATLRH